MTKSVWEMNCTAVNNPPLNDFVILNWAPKYTDDHAQSKLFHTYYTDPLVLSCMRHRIVKENPDAQVVVTLDDKEMTHLVIHAAFSVLDMVAKHQPEMLTEFDKKLASDIRDHFSTKLSDLILKDEDLTLFRQNLSKYVSEVMYSIPESYNGMIITLPELYNYDMEVTELFETTEQDITKYDSEKSTRTETLFLVKSLLSGNSVNRKVEYWLKDTDNRLYVFKIEAGNKLRPVFEQQLRLAPLTIKCNASHREHAAGTRGNYFQISGFSVDKAP